MSLIESGGPPLNVVNDGEVGEVGFVVDRLLNRARRADRTGTVSIESAGMISWIAGCEGGVAIVVTKRALVVADGFDG